MTAQAPGRLEQVASCRAARAASTFASAGSPTVCDRDTVITEELEAFGAAEVTAASELTRADRFLLATVLEGSMTTVFTTN